MSSSLSQPAQFSPELSTVWVLPAYPLEVGRYHPSEE